ncbi:hypothetical protein M3Y99_01101900 [Aphelenchoides fujianensis]|nr:hypothetical protein M3Y99_01101900 [Aphelenchoides fujianensis]
MPRRPPVDEDESLRSCSPSLCSVSTTVLAETQRCDGGCQKVRPLGELRVYDCGHVICGDCWTELSTGVLAEPAACRLGACRTKRKEAAACSSTTSTAEYLADTRSAFRQPTSPLRPPSRSSSACSCTGRTPTSSVNAALDEVRGDGTSDFREFFTQ